MTEAQARIEEIMRGGGALGDAEDFIEASAWSAEQKAALWLYAWSLQPTHVQRVEATVMMAYAG